MTTMITAHLPFTAADKRRVILLLLLIYVVNYADRTIIGVVGEAIKNDLGLSDTQLGLLGGTSFTILYVLTSFPVGRLVERLSRVSIIWIAVATWSLGTVLCGTAQNFTQLLLYRAAVGMGEGGFIPAVLSLLSDYFPPNRRASAYSMVVFGLPIGGAIGAMGGGWLAAHYHWEVAFFVLGAPGLLLALMVRKWLREPPRGYSEPGATVAAEAPGSRAVFAALARKPAFFHLATAAGFCQIVGYAMALFLFPYLVRNFGLNYAQGGAIVGLLNGAATGIGILAGGTIADRLGRRDVRWYGWAPALVMTAVAPIYLAAFMQSDLLIAMTLLFIPATAVSAFSPTVAATIQGLVEPRMRGTTAALHSALSNIISLGLGATLTGLASDFFANRAFAAAGGVGQYAASCSPRPAATVAEICASASATGVRHALIAISIFLLWGALHFLLAARSLKRSLASNYEQRG
jgi:predicted MFS family arabinose efflux permease